MKKYAEMIKGLTGPNREINSLLAEDGSSRIDIKGETPSLKIRFSGPDSLVISRLMCFGMVNRGMVPKYTERRRSTSAPVSKRTSEISGNKISFTRK